MWSLCEEGLLEGYISAISVNNVFYIAQKLKQRAYAQQLVDALLKDFQIIPLDAEMLKLARTLDEYDYEDLIQYFSAIRSGSQYVITRNEKDFPKRGIETIRPDLFLNHFIQREQQQMS